MPVAIAEPSDTFWSVCLLPSEAMHPYSFIVFEKGQNIWD